MVYIHVNNIDAPQVVTDQNQQVVWKADYKPFGEVTKTVSMIDMPLRFAGQYFDEETGLHQNWNRDYDPYLGRYVEADPIGINGGLNLFAYVGGNPLVRIDPMGYKWKFVGWQAEEHFGWWSHWRKLFARCENDECGEKKVKLEYVLYEQWRPISINTTPTPSYGSMGNSSATNALMDLVEAGMQAHSRGSMSKFEYYLSLPSTFGQQFCDRIKE